MPEFSFTVHGEAVPKGRPRAFTNKKTGRAGLYTPAKTRSFEDLIRQRALMAWTLPPLEGPITVNLAFWRKVPESWSAKKRAAALAGLIYPTTKPDLDNLEKSVLDALNRVLYCDDAQVVKKNVAKSFGLMPRTEVTILW